MSTASIPPYPEYVPASASWLGSIPAGWRALRGKYSFREYSERSETGSEVLLSVSEYFGVKPRRDAIDADEHLSRADSLIGYKKCNVADLAMNIMLAWKKGLGVSKYEGIVSPAYSVFRFMKHACPDYMHYLLRTDLYVDYFKARSTGIMDSRLRLYPNVFGDIALLLPSEEEQTQIARFLDYETAKIDALIEKQQQLITLLKEKRQAVISHAVTKGLNPDAPLRDSGVEWLGEVPAHWATAKLARFIRVGSGEFLPNDEYSEIRESETGRLIPVVGGNGVSGWASKSNSPPRTMVIGRVGALCGNVHLVNEASWVTDNALRVSSSSDFVPEYLVDLLRVRNLNDLADRSAQPLITGSRIKGQAVPVPPVEEQKEIAQFITDRQPQFSALVEKVSSAIVLIQERRTALISAAVTGKIDVRNWKSPGDE